MVYRAGGVDYLLISGPIPPVGAVQGGRGRGWGQGGGEGGGRVSSLGFQETRAGHEGGI